MPIGVGPELEVKLKQLLDGSLSEDQISRLVNSWISMLQALSGDSESALQQSASHIVVDDLRNKIARDSEAVLSTMFTIRLPISTIQPLMKDYDYNIGTGYAMTNAIRGWISNGDIAISIVSNLLTANHRFKESMIPNANLVSVGIGLGEHNQSDDPISNEAKMETKIVNIMNEGEAYLIPNGLDSGYRELSIMGQGMRLDRLIKPIIRNNFRDFELSSSIHNASSILNLYRKAFQKDLSQSWDPRYTRPLIIYVGLMITLSNCKLDLITKTARIQHTYLDQNDQSQTINLKLRSFDDFKTMPFPGVPTGNTRLRRMLAELHLDRQGIIDSEHTNSYISDDSIQLTLEKGDYSSSYTRCKYGDYILDLSRITAETIQNYFRTETWDLRHITVIQRDQGYSSVIPYRYDLVKMKLWKTSILYGMLANQDHFLTVMNHAQSLLEKITIVEPSDKSRLDPLDSQINASATIIDSFGSQFSANLSSHGKKTGDYYWLMMGSLYNGIGSTSLDTFRYKLEKDMTGVVKLISSIYVLPFLTDHFALAKVIQMMANWQESGHRVIYEEGSMMTAQTPASHILRWNDMPMLCRVDPIANNHGGAAFAPMWIVNFYRLCHQTFANSSFTMNKHQFDDMPNWDYFTENDPESLTLRYGSNNNVRYAVWPNLGADEYNDYITAVAEWIQTDLRPEIKKFLPHVNDASYDISKIAPILNNALLNFRIYLYYFYANDVKMIASQLPLPFIQRKIWIRGGQVTDPAGIDIRAYNSEYYYERLNQINRNSVLSSNVNDAMYYIDPIGAFYAMCLMAPRSGTEAPLSPSVWYDELEIWNELLDHLLRRAGQINDYNSYYRLLMSAVQLTTLNGPWDNWESLARFTGIEVPDFSNGEFMRIYERYAELIGSGFGMKYKPFDLLFANYSYVNPPVRILRKTTDDLPNQIIESFDIPPTPIDRIDEALIFNVGRLGRNPGMMNFIGRFVRLRCGRIIDDPIRGDPSIHGIANIPAQAIRINSMTASSTTIGLLINDQPVPQAGSSLVIDLNTLAVHRPLINLLMTIADNRDYIIYVEAPGLLLGELTHYTMAVGAVKRFLFSCTDAGEIGICQIPGADYLPGGGNRHECEREFKFPIHVNQSFVSQLVIQWPNLDADTDFTFMMNLHGERNYRDMMINEQLDIQDFIDRIREPARYNELMRTRPQLVSYHLRFNAVAAEFACTLPHA